MLKRGLKKFLAVACLSIIGTVAPVSLAYAGGGNCVGGGCEWNGSADYVMVWLKLPGWALGSDSRLADYRNGLLRGPVAGGISFRPDLNSPRVFQNGSEAYEFCATSEYVYYIGFQSNHVGAYNGLIPPTYTFGRALSANGYINTEYDRLFENELRKPYAGGLISIICSNSFGKRKSFTERDVKSSLHTVKATVPIEYSIDISRNISRGGKDPIGANNLHNQRAKKRTPYYDFVLYLRNNSSTSAEDAKKKYKEAHSKAKRQTYSASLDNKNKEGMAEGGVLDVTKRATWASFVAQTGKEQKIKRSCSAMFINKNGFDEEVSGTRECGSWTNDGDPVETHMSKATISSTPSVESFFQILSVHCNLPGFNKLLSSISGKYSNVHRDERNGAIFATLTTKPQINPYKLTDDLTELERQAQGIDLDTLQAIYYHDAEYKPINVTSGVKFSNVVGQGTSNVSSKLAFYTKECPFDCQLSGAVNPYGSDNNKEIGLNKPKGSSTPLAWNLKNTNLLGNYFEIFRDNKPVSLRLNLWTPKRTDSVRYKGEKAITTTIVRDSKGTPGTDPKGSGVFRMATNADDANNGVSIFSKNDSTIPVQKDFDASTFSGSNLAILNGQYRDFWVLASWASNEGRPNKFNFKWEFDPQVKSVFATSATYKGDDNTSPTIKFSDAYTAIQGKCYAESKATVGKNTIDLFYKNTGEDVKNGLDNHVFGGNYDLIINAIRGTTQ